MFDLDALAAAERRLSGICPATKAAASQGELAHVIPADVPPEAYAKCPHLATLAREGRA